MEMEPVSEKLVYLNHLLHMSATGFTEFGCRECSNTWKNYININSEEMGFEGVNCNHLNQEKNQC